MNKSEKTSLVIMAIFVLAMLIFVGYMAFDKTKNPSLEAETDSWCLDEYIETIFVLGAAWGYREAVMKKDSNITNLRMTEDEWDAFTNKAKGYWSGRKSP